MKILLILISILFLNDSNLVHQDTPLQIDKKGKIIGLPGEFSPAKIDLKKKYLRINNKEIVFPECLDIYFGEFEKPMVNLSASWYHSKDILPYYLNIKIYQENKNKRYRILVDLETLELIAISEKIIEGNLISHPKIELEKKCLTEYEVGIKTLKH